MKYARELEAEIERLRVPLRDVWGREMAGVAVDLESKWSIARDQLHIELKAAAERNGKLQRIIDSPEFKEAFSADGIDNSGADLAGTLVEEASKELFVFVAGAKTYESLTGPHVRAFVFVRDSAYNALLSYFSTERVLQQNELAGELAKAAGVLQAKYQRDVDALKECRQ